jgi:lambda family phage portal protein
MSRVGEFIKTAGGLLAPRNGRGDLRARAGYMNDGRGVTMSGWRPSLRESSKDVEQAYLPAAARATDALQNMGWIAGAVEQSVVDTVGNGLRLNAKPDADALGMDPARAAEWAKIVEKRFNVWANNPYECDVEGRRNLGQMQAANFRGWAVFGETVSEFPYRKRPGATYGTKVRLIPAYRLSQKTELMGRLVQGVRMDPDGLPVSYVFELPDATLGKREVEILARDAYGRPKINHVYDGLIGHYRGISPLVPALRVVRQYDQLANATLMAAIIQSLFAASIESDAPTDDILDGLLTIEEQAEAQKEGISKVDAWFEAQSGWYEKKQIDMGINGRIANLFPGQELKFLSSSTPNGNYQAFARDLLREIARCLGITYEGMTGDYAGVTFSSIRFAVDNIWRIVTYRRKNVVAPFCQAAYEAWLEEEIGNGGPLALPGGLEQFLANKAGICNADWKGTPKPTPDELKTANAQNIRLENGTASEQMICEENGEDYDDVCAEKAEAKKTREKYGLPEPVATTPAAAKPGANPNDPAYQEPPKDGKDGKDGRDGAAGKDGKPAKERA